MITADETLRAAADKERQSVLTHADDDPRETISNLSYLNFIMGIRQEEMLSILLEAGLITTEQYGRGPDHEGLSAAWEKAKAIKSGVVK